jgi:hypothetical protein
MLVYSREPTGDVLTFKFYDSSADPIYDITETIPFVDDMIVGSPNDPYIMHVVELPCFRHGVMGNGGDRAANSSYSLSGSTIGQPVVGSSLHPSYTLQAGFWHPYEWTGVPSEPPATVPEAFGFTGIYPNPFNPVTTMHFSVPRACHLTIRIYSVAGREVGTPVDEEAAPGHYVRVLDARDLPSGVYFVRMTAGTSVETRKLVLLR